MRLTVAFAVLSTAALSLVPGVAAASASAPAAAAVAHHPVTAAAPTASNKGKIGGSIELPDAVSQSAASWTPNIYQGNCGSTCTHSTVYSTAVVGSEVVVAGSFGAVCTPADTGYADCPSTVPVDDIFAYNIGTGAIDPDFMPTLDQGPVYSVVAGPGDTVYAGGAFNTVDGASHAGVVKLVVDPGESDDGQVVSAFTAQLPGSVHNLAVKGTALYAGGLFRTVDGTPQRAIARLNGTSGADDPSFQFTLGDAISGTKLQVEAMALSADGSTVAIGGSFQTVNGQPYPRLALISTGGRVGSTATLENWSSPVLANNCERQHDYVNAIDFSPDGSFFVVVTAGYTTTGGEAICDAAARYETGVTGTDVQPTWVNYDGADSLHSVAIAGAVVYIGGHDRWSNNECGLNHECEPAAVLNDGLAALDANTGLSLAWWHPQTKRDVGVQSLTLFPAGLYSGSDGGLIIGTSGDIIAGAKHNELGMFPLLTTASQAAGGPVPAGMFADGRIDGTEGTDSGIAAMCLTDANDGSAPGNPVTTSTCLNDAAQNWTVGSGQTLQINGLCLDTADGGTTAGTLTVLDTCDGDTSQQWAPGAGNILVNQASGLCLDDPDASTTSGTQLQILGCDGAAEQNWPLPVAQAPPPPPPTGPLYMSIVEHDSNVPCLSDVKDKTTPGAKTELAICYGYAWENWTAEADGTLQINGLCLDTVDGGTTKGTLTDLNTCDGAASQVWTPGTDYALVNEASNMCLDEPSTSGKPGTATELWPCNNTKNEQWRLPEY